MIQFKYNEIDSKTKRREVYIIYYKDKIYYSKPFIVPAKLEIDRDRKEITINNMIIDSDREMCLEIFKLIISMKNVLDIENYYINKDIKSGELYKQIYQKDIL
jgi:hypothetical protein